MTRRTVIGVLTKAEDGIVVRNDRGEEITLSQMVDDLIGKRVVITIHWSDREK